MTPLRETAWRLKHHVGEAFRDAVSMARSTIARIDGRRKRRRGDAPRILVIDEMLPDPKFGAGYPRAAELLDAIVRAGWRATMYPMVASPDDYAGVRARFPGQVRFLRARGEPGLRRLIRESVGRFETVLISRAPVMESFDRISTRFPAFARETYRIYDAEATFTASEALRLRLFGTPMSAAAYAAALDAEFALVHGLEAVISVTEAEARLFRSRTPAPVYVISHTTTVRTEAPDFDARSDFLFVGRSTGGREYSPNVDSLIWFVDEVMPLLDALLGPDYRLIIVGRADEALVTRLASARVVFAGIVDALDPWYDRGRVFVAPTRYAAGLPLKVVDAGAAGIPCVVTGLLADQMGIHDGVECRTGDTPDAFAAACAALYEDRASWTRVRDGARERIAADYSRETFRSSVAEVLMASIASDPPARGGGGAAAAR